MNDEKRLEIEKEEPAAETSNEPSDPAPPTDIAQASTEEREAQVEEMSLDEMIETGLVHPLVLDALKEARETARNAEEARLRALAEMQNQRARLFKERDTRIQFANESLLLDLLPVLDNLELCLRHGDETMEIETLRQGVELTALQFRQVLTGLGVEEIHAAPGDSFEPKSHEAVLSEEKEGLPDGTIVRVTRAGFRYRDRLLRPAQVVVVANKVASDSVVADEKTEKEADMPEETSSSREPGRSDIDPSDGEAEEECCNA